MSSFDGSIGRTSAESTPARQASVKAPAGAPNVVVIVLDDVGFAHLGCYGSDIATPNMDRLAAEGLRYVSFQATPMCAPTRACLMTGRNSHSVGVGTVGECAMGFPGYSGGLSKKATTLAEVLGPSGYNCFAIGKWHLAPVEHCTPAGPFDCWPLQRGFDRYYGFIESATDQWHPELIEGNQRIHTPDDSGYHLTEDLVDQAITYILEQTSSAPDRPFFTYLALGACHSPLQVPRPFIERYKGRYDGGWDAARDEWFERQRHLGIVPETTRLAPRNPGVEAWDALTADQRKLYARYQEVFAGFMEHTDTHVGRLMSVLDEIERADNTLVVLLSDNGASDSGGLHGWVHPHGRATEPDVALDHGLAVLDRLGDDTTRPMYPIGWAQVGNTPFRHYKIDTYAGGTSVPLVVRWPNRITDHGGIRRQYHHAVDIYPTILELVGVEAPPTYAGVDQLPVHGTSMTYTFDDADAPTRKRVQYFENFGHRAIWQDGWKAATKHIAGDDYSTEQWALYDLANDYSEYEDLAEKCPEQLRQLIELWWAEAGRYDVLPLDDDPGERQQALFGTPKPRYVYYPGSPPISSRMAPVIADRAHTITAQLEVPGSGCEGVILAVGGAIGGYVLYVEAGHPVYEYNLFGARHAVRSDRPLPAGPASVRFAFTRTGTLQGVGTLSIDDQAVGRVELPETIPSIGPESPGPVNCGRDGSSPVSDAYQSPFAFTGRIRSVVVEPVL
jgi:arylsulfatase A-like enzyme